MSSSNSVFSVEYMIIPPIFHCYATHSPFEECLICKKNLLVDGTQYVIEKAVRKYPEFNTKDVVTEYAICLNCNEQMRQTLSGHSKKVMDDYFSKKVDLSTRRQRLLQEKGAQLDAWLNNCLIYNTPQNTLTEYQIYAHCDGKHLVFTDMPFMISGQAINEIAELLSVETKEVLDNFIDQHFGLPPEYKSMLKDRKMILL
jgi:hypothetical protein